MQDLINQVLKTDKKELNKTQLYTLQEVIGVPESVRRFLRSGLPFDFAIPYTKEKIDAVVNIIKTIRKDISHLIPPEKFQAHFNPTSTSQSLSTSREELIHLYANKVIENHALMMNGNKVSNDNQALFNTVAFQVHQNVLEERGGADVFLQIKREYEKKLMDSLLSPTSNMEDFINSHADDSKNQPDSAIYRMGLKACAQMLADKLKGIMGAKHPEIIEYFVHPKLGKKNRANLSEEGQEFFDFIVKSFQQDPLARYLQDLNFQQIFPQEIFSEMDSDLFELNLGDNAEKILRKNKNLGKIQQPYTQEMVQMMHEMITALREDLKKNQDILDVLDDKARDLSLTLDEKKTLIFFIMRSYCSQFFRLAVKGQPYASDILNLYLSVEGLYDEVEQPKKIHKKIMQETADKLADEFFHAALIDKSSYAEKNAGFLFHAITIASESSYFNYLEKSIIEKLVTLPQKTQNSFYDACKELQDSGLLEQLNEKGRTLHKKIFNASDEKSGSEIFMFSPRTPRFSPRIEDLKGSNEFIDRSNSGSLNSSSSSISSSSSTFPSSSITPRSPETPRSPTTPRSPATPRSPTTPRSSATPRSHTKLPRTLNFSKDVELIPKLSELPKKAHRPLPDDLPEIPIDESSEDGGGRFWKKNQ